MDTKLAERLFILVTSDMDHTYEEECNMTMDAFLEEEFDMGRLKRILLYLLDKVRADRREMVKEKIEQRIGSLHKQWLVDFARPPCFSSCGKCTVLIASVKWRPSMKEFIRLRGIAACTLPLLTGCSSEYKRDDEPGRVENVTVARIQEMVDRKESFAIVFTQTTCSHCIKFKRVLNGYLLDHSVVLYDVILDEAPASQRKSDLDTIRKAFPGMNEAPSPYCMKGGKLESLLGNGDDGLTEEKSDSWVQRYKLDKEE